MINIHKADNVKINIDDLVKIRVISSVNNYAGKYYYVSKDTQEYTGKYLTDEDFFWVSTKSVSKYRDHSTIYYISEISSEMLKKFPDAKYEPYSNIPRDERIISVEEIKNA